MNLRVYNGEKYERSKWWYVFFALVFILVLLLSLWKKNIVGSIVLFLVLGSYFYYNILINQIVSITLDTEHLIIDKKIYSWNYFLGYVLELETSKQVIKNIVFVGSKGHIVYTIADDNSQLKKFITALDEYIPLLSEYNQTSLEKILRILQL